jgi:hypothetical protein
MSQRDVRTTLPRERPRRWPPRRPGPRGDPVAWSCDRYRQCLFAAEDRSHVHRVRRPTNGGPPGFVFVLADSIDEIVRWSTLIGYGIAFGLLAAFDVLGVPALVQLGVFLGIITLLTSTKPWLVNQAKKRHARRTTVARSRGAMNGFCFRPCPHQSGPAPGIRCRPLASKGVRVAGSGTPGSGVGRPTLPTTQSAPSARLQSGHGWRHTDVCDRQSQRLSRASRAHASSPSCVPAFTRSRACAARSHPSPAPRR